MCYSVGLIGLGKIGLGYDLDLDSTYIQTHYRAVLDQKRMKLAFVFDVNTSTYKHLDNRVTTLSNLKQVKEHLSEIDVLIIATPTATHMTILQQLELKQDDKLIVLLEKPVGDSLSSNIKINEYLQNTIYRVNYVRRSLPAFSKIKKYLSQVSDWEMYCEFNGDWHNIGSHFFDLFLFLSDQKDDLNYVWLNENTLEVRFMNKSVLVLVRKIRELDFPYSYQIKANKTKIIFDEKRDQIQVERNSFTEMSIRLNLSVYQKHVFNDLIELLDTGVNLNLADGKSSSKFHQILGKQNVYQ